MPDGDVDVAQDRRTVAIGADRLHALWIRDACTCGECRRPSSNERLFDSTLIDPDIVVESAQVVDGHVRFAMSDGHVVLIGLDSLRGHLSRRNVCDHPAVNAQIWHHGFQPARFDRGELDDLLREGWWLDAIAGSGVAIVSGVDPSTLGLVDVVRRIGEIRATNYGVTWEIEATIDPVTAVDSERHLLVHTDLPYREAAPGVQFLLAAVVEVDGGATTLVDGYGAAEQVRASDPRAWELLSTTEFTYPFVRDDIEFHGRSPLIALQSDGTYHQIRWAPDLVGVPFVDAADAPDLYRAVRLWNTAVDDPDNTITVELAPGDLLAIHNHRVLHGRTAFELGASGRRRLLGCYLDIDDLHSRRAVLHRSLETLGSDPDDSSGDAGV